MEILSLSGSFTVSESDTDFYYVGGDTGVVIIRKSDNKEVAYSTVESGVSSIWAGDSEFLYLGTVTSGVCRLPKYEYLEDVPNSSNSLYSYLRVPELLDDSVLSIDALNSNHLVVGTVSGINVVSGSTNYSSSFLNNVSTLRVTDLGEVYYGGQFGIAKMSTVSGNWDEPDYLLNTITIPPIPPVSQIDVVTGDQNVVGVSTEDGVYIYKEEDIISNSSILLLLKE